MRAGVTQNGQYPRLTASVQGMDWTGWGNWQSPRFTGSLPYWLPVSLHPQYIIKAISHSCIIERVIDLSEIRRIGGVTQVQLAAALNTSQGQVSRLERQSDMLLSTLSAYFTALGASATLVIDVNGETLECTLTGEET